MPIVSAFKELAAETSTGVSVHCDSGIGTVWLRPGSVEGLMDNKLVSVEAHYHRFCRTYN